MGLLMYLPELMFVILVYQTTNFLIITIRYCPLNDRRISAFVLSPVSNEQPIT